MIGADQGGRHHATRVEDVGQRDRQERGLSSLRRYGEQRSSALSNGGRQRGIGRQDGCTQGTPALLLSGEPGPGLALIEWLYARSIVARGTESWSIGPVPGEDPARPPPFVVPRTMYGLAPAA